VFFRFKGSSRNVSGVKWTRTGITRLERDMAFYQLAMFRERVSARILWKDAARSWACRDYRLALCRSTAIVLHRLGSSMDMHPASIHRRTTQLCNNAPSCRLTKFGYWLRVLGVGRCIASFDPLFIVILRCGGIVSIRCNEQTFSRTRDAP